MSKSSSEIKNRMRVISQQLLQAVWAGTALAVTLPLMAAPASAQSYSTQGVNGRNLSVAYFDGGRFEQTSNGVWKEYGLAGGPRFTFRETQRDAWSVYLRDDGRNGDLQLDVHRMMISAGWDGSARSDLYKITSVARKENRTAPKPPPAQSAEIRCYNMVQGKVAWNRSGSTSWTPANVRSLCKGTTNPTARVNCFKNGINAHGTWSRAINDCKSGKPAPKPTPVPTPVSNAKVSLYQHCNYGGYRVDLPPGGYGVSSLIAKGMVNDDISSIKVSPGYKVEIYEHTGYQGARRTLTGNTSCLTTYGMNDQVSSVKVLRSQAPSTPAPKPRPQTVSLEQQCFNMVQGKVAWNRSGNKSWSSSNVKSLCKGTRNPTRTKTCFESGIRNHGKWEKSIADCKTGASVSRAAPKPKPATPQWVSHGVNGRNVSAAYHNGGRFEETGKGTGIWKEYGTSGGANFTFREKNRDDWSVYMRDASRGVDIQIDVHRKMIRYGENGGAMRDQYATTHLSRIN